MTDTEFHEFPEEKSHPPRDPAPSSATFPKSAGNSTAGEKASLAAAATEINDPAAVDADAPLDIPWGKVVLYLVVAWAVFRFAWLIFESGG
ncbi:MAG: hypothetical protein ACLFRG_22575 [Desulfococcaceae bacterium]